MDGVRVERDGDVLVLVLDRQDKKNAITDAMYGALADALESVETDASARTVLIRSEGDTFTAGNDLADFARANAQPGQGPTNVRRFLTALTGCTRPIVAAVQGKAVGVGTTMLLHCDFVLLAEDAALSTPFVNLALVPEAGSTMLLPATIGHARAFAMFATGESVDAQTALSWGLASKVVANQDLAAAALAVAAALAAKPLGALSATKHLMRNAEAVLAQMDAESREFAERLRSPEAAEAFGAFMAPRKPDFSQFR